MRTSYLSKKHQDSKVRVRHQLPSWQRNWSQHHGPKKTGVQKEPSLIASLFLCTWREGVKVSMDIAKHQLWPAQHSSQHSSCSIGTYTLNLHFDPGEFSIAQEGC